VSSLVLSTASGAEAQRLIPCGPTSPGCPRERGGFTVSTPGGTAFALHVGWWNARLPLRDRTFAGETNGTAFSVRGEDLGYDAPHAMGMAFEPSILFANRFGLLFHLAVGAVEPDAPLTRAGSALLPSTRSTFQVAAGPSIALRFGRVIVQGALLLGYRAARVSVSNAPGYVRYPCGHTGCAQTPVPIVDAPNLVTQPRLNLDAILVSSRSLAFGVGVTAALDLFPSPSPQVTLHLALWSPPQ